MASITLTFGDVAENHAGMQKLGTPAERGFDIDDLSARLVAQRIPHEMFDLVQMSGITDQVLQPAALFVIRGGVDRFVGSDQLLVEQLFLKPDKKAFMYGKVVNKLARHNLCFSDEPQEPNYEEGRGRVVAFSQVPILSRLRTLLPTMLGEQAFGLQCEENYYYDITKCGIGLHGDGERRIVIAAKLGSSIPLHYQWFFRNKPIGNRIEISPPLRHGDLYVMSEKAVGTDWKRSSIPTLRHAAGCVKFLSL